MYFSRCKVGLKVVLAPVVTVYNNCKLLTRGIFGPWDKLSPEHPGCTLSAAAVLIVLELTQSYGFAVAALMSVMASMLLTHRLFGASFFDRQLMDRGINLAHGREAIALAQNTLKGHVNDDYVSLSETNTGHEALEKMREKQQTEAYVISGNGCLAGKLSIHQAIEAESKSVFNFLDSQPILLHLDDPLSTAMHVVSDFVGESLPIIDRNDRRFLGVITEGDLFKAVITVQSDVRSSERE